LYREKRHRPDQELVPNHHAPVLRPAQCPSLEGTGEKWDFGKWQPHLVVINLFQNDSWTRKGTSKNEAVPAYVGFVKTISGHYPKARIVCTLGSMSAGKGPWGGWVKDAVKQLNDEGDEDVYCYIFTVGTGSRHPNQNDHEKMAEELTTFVKTLDLKPDPAPVASESPLEQPKPMSAKERLMRSYLIDARKRFETGRMSKATFKRGLEKLAEAVPGSRTADMAIKMAAEL